MKITILAVGKIKEKFFTDAVGEYSRRLSRYCSLEIREVADEATPDKASPAMQALILEREGERLIRVLDRFPGACVIALAIDGITSLSVKPLRLITGFGLLVAAISFIGVLWALISAIAGRTVAGWASMTCIICFVSGVQILCLGVIAEYIGKIYMETKQRPRYIISERTWDEKEE